MSGALVIPERPTLKRIAQLNGAPPWRLPVPYPYPEDVLPKTVLDCVGELELEGRVFVLKGTYDEVVAERDALLERIAELEAR